MTIQVRDAAQIKLRFIQSAVFGAGLFVSLWLSIGLFALLRILRPEAASWLPVSGSLYTLGGMALVVGAVLPIASDSRARTHTLALTVLGLWIVVTAVQFVAFMSRPDASALLYLWNFVRWGAALALATYGAAWAATRAVDRLSS